MYHKLEPTGLVFSFTTFTVWLCYGRMAQNGFGKTALAVEKNLSNVLHPSTCAPLACFLACTAPFCMYFHLLHVPPFACAAPSSLACTVPSCMCPHWHLQHVSSSLHVLPPPACAPLVAYTAPPACTPLHVLPPSGSKEAPSSLSPFDHTREEWLVPAPRVIV